MRKTKLKFRPHHFMCTLGFVGKGYSPDFVQGFQAIADRLRGAPDGDEVLIEIVDRTDSICEPCPNRRDERCESEARIRTLDDAHARTIGFRIGETLSWGEAKQRIAERMNEENFDSDCAPCSWKSLGVCRAALRSLKKSSGRTSAPSLAIFLSGFLSWGSIAGLVHAAPAPSLSPRPSPGAPVAIDVLQERMQKGLKNPSARAIADALTAIEQKNYARARQRVRALRDDALFSDYAHAIAARALREEAKLKLAKGAADAALKDAQQAFDEYARILIKNPESTLASRTDEELAAAELLMGHAYAIKKSWKRSRSAYEKAFLRIGERKSIFIAQVTLIDIENFGESCVRTESENCDSWLSRIAQYYPKGSEENRALGKHQPKFAARSAVPDFSGKLTSRSYRAPDLDTAAFDAAWTLYRDREYKDAALALAVFLDEFPRSTHRHRALYWLARSHLESGNDEEGSAVFKRLIQEAPLTYYGLLASIATGQSLEPTISALLPEGTDREPYLWASERIRLKRAEEFLRVGAHDLARSDLREIRPRSAHSDAFLIYLSTLNHEAGGHRGAFVVLSELIQRSHPGIFSTFGLRQIFPVVHMPIIEKMALEFRLDPILVLSLIKQESAFDVTAISSSGASGLMQLMPATAVDTEPKVHLASLAEPTPNIRVGTRYLAKVLKRFDGNVVYSLAGYNAGPNAVARWVKERRSHEGMLEFIESIPYSETRGYVSSILRNYFWYSRNIKGVTLKNLDQFWVEPSASPETKK